MVMGFMSIESQNSKIYDQTLKCCNVCILIKVVCALTDDDWSCFQVYTITVTREQIPLAVTFCDVKDQMEFECPVSLNAFYRPLSVSPR